MDVDVRDLELLDALSEHETLTAAARHLYVSQPALSQRLLRLEERLATPLFDRRGRRLVATAAGRRMFHAAHVALGELRAAQVDLRDLAGGRHQPVRLMSQCSTNYQWLTPVLRTFRQRMTGAEIRLESVPDHDAVAALLDERLDVALVTKLDRHADHVRLDRLFDDELRGVVAVTHPWAGRAAVGADDFVDQHLVLYDSYDPARTPSVALPIPPGARPARLTTVPVETDLIVEMVAAGDAITVLPSWIVAPYLATHPVTTVAVGDPPQARTWYCATRHGPRRDLVAAFIDTVTGHLGGRPPQ